MLSIPSSSNIDHCLCDQHSIIQRMDTFREGIINLTSDTKLNDISLGGGGRGQKSQEVLPTKSKNKINQIKNGERKYKRIQMFLDIHGFSHF